MEDDYQQPKPTLSLASLLKVPIVKKTKIVNERQALIAEALERINTGSHKWTVRGLVFKVSHVKTDDLRDLIFLCGKSHNFSRCFFGKLKVK